MSDTEKEIQQFKKRLADLADKSAGQGIFTFTPFLSMNEQDIFWQMEKELKYAGYTIFGGTEHTERNVIRFGDPKELGYEVDFAIRCIHIRPLLPKFADDLTHRDFLGAVMNLGIERSTIGDIMVGDKEAYLFCLEQVADFICENLDKIRHTNVRCEVTESIGEIPVKEPEIIRIQAASLRLDAVIAKLYHMSRSECQELFRAGKVFIDGRLCESPSRTLKSGECVTARGYGRFTLQGGVIETRKGKVSAEFLVNR